MGWVHLEGDSCLRSATGLWRVGWGRPAWSSRWRKEKNHDVGTVFVKSLWPCVFNSSLQRLGHGWSLKSPHWGQFQWPGDSILWAASLLINEVLWGLKLHRIHAVGDTDSGGKGCLQDNSWAYKVAQVFASENSNWRVLCSQDGEKGRRLGEPRGLGGMREATVHTYYLSGASHPSLPILVLRL